MGDLFDPWRDFSGAKDGEDGIVRRWKWCGFDCGFESWTEENPSFNGHVVTCIIPYWSIIFPLTLLSAILLLSNPRKSTQKKISEPVADEGA